MDDITLNLIVIFIAAVLGLGIFLILRSKKAKEEQHLHDWAKSHGWQFESVHEPLMGGFRIKSDQWVLASISQSSGREAGPGSSEISMQTTWRTAQPGSTIIIGTRPQQAQLDVLSQPFAQKALQWLAGDQISGLSEIKTGSTSFQQRFILLAQDEAIAEKFLGSGLETALLSWKGPNLLIKQSADGLSIYLKGTRLKKEEDVLELIRLGELLTRRSNW